ncbi:Arylsulfatase A [Rubritalea squalenifaciens DSM 18772]|uniref:Arylsulfatase A n=1 Tax=Rubritalea squalenifaciens DSM 18772 TaxID=1123071 RepID=A0A1M6BD14_9BACT|nr:sulfatase [Rubritalea squalenifaciens]SHI46458.1 Arylsulfatase A [Rubritalea squalenifaciens DSM 18772]
MKFKQILTVFLVMAAPLVAAPKNALFIFADDLGYTDLGCFGSSFYETPNLDALCADAMKLTNAYAACPVCSPTRSSVLTGQYPARTRNTDYFGAYNPKPGSAIPKHLKNRPVSAAPYVERLPAELTTLPEALKEHGYATFFAGKWHLGPKGSWPTDHGFDINKGGWTRGGPYGGKKYFSPYGNPVLEDGPDGEHLPDRLAQETNKFINATGDKPFFAMLSFYSVHTPLIGRKDLVEKYKKKAEKLAYSKEETWGFDTPRKVRLKQDHAVYGAMVEAMDEAVGKVIDNLKKSGKYEDTVIIFYSDNGGLSTSEGWPTSNLPLRAGKGWLYEGGIREPAMIRIPGVTKAGSSLETPITSTDIFPTILESCGLPLQPKVHVDGVSLLKTLKAEKERALYWHYPHWGNQGGSPGGAVRLGDYKYIRYYTGKPAELFNLKEDPSEKNNLIDKQPEMAKKLSGMFDAWLKETDAVMPIKNPDYDGKLKKW